MIEVTNLSYQYSKTATPAIKEISFNVKKGEIFGFIGPSGAGKSTVQKVLIGLLEDYQGSVNVFGEEMKSKSKNFYERIGVAFEFPNFYHKLTGMENLRLFQNLYPKKTIKPEMLLEQVGLSEAANTRFEKYSKGMKMRLNFCRAILNDPDILFLDEPTSGLDPTNSKLLKEMMLAKKAEGKTIILTTHHMHMTEELCNRVAFIVDGQLALVDSPENLKQQGAKKNIVVEYKQDDAQKGKSTFPLENIAKNEDFQLLINTKEIHSIHTVEKTMEDVFIEVTGKKLSP